VLCSNACKFTPAGGKVTIRTKLVLPQHTSETARDSVNGGLNDQTEANGDAPLPPSSAADRAEEHSWLDTKTDGPQQSTSRSHTDRIVVRIELSDTGSGIKPEDMDQAKLFCEFLSLFEIVKHTIS
jgi:osomolarity two-component system, sensor histidine kinase SLN1